MTFLKYDFVIFGTMAIVLVILIAGIINLGFTGKKAASRSNQLMRWRVGIQFIAIIALMIGFWIKSHN